MERDRGAGRPDERRATGLTGPRAETTLYLVRHGESEANAAGRFAGQTDSPLTELGRRQAEVVADALRDVRFDRVISSDLSRARDTAAAIARRHGIEVEAFPELREIDVGEAEGRTFEDARQRPDWTPEGFVQWPGGESLEAALGRVTAVIDRLVAEDPGKAICLVGHGGTTRILVSHFLGLLPKLYRHPTPSANTNITVVRTDGITYRVDSLFEAGHLAPSPPSPEERMPEPGLTEGGPEGAGDADPTDG